MAENVPRQRPILDTEAWQRDHGSPPGPAAVRPGVHAWARTDDRDGRREVHGHACAGAGAALRPYLRAFRRVHNQDLALDVATYEAMLHAKRVTPERIRRMCVGNPATHASYT